MTHRHNTARPLPTLVQPPTHSIPTPPTPPQPKHRHTIHGLSNRAPPHTLNTSITFNDKLATTPKHIANCFTKQILSNMQRTKQTDTLTEQQTTYKDTTSHSLLLRSKSL